MERNHRKVEVGVVTSDRMHKTINVRTERMVKHPLYKKYIRRYSDFKAHDERNEASTGDRVEIQETRPLSKTKRWRLVRILVKAAGSDVPAERKQ
jgi:small subunit ribosomal protein S17